MLLLGDIFAQYDTSVFLLIILPKNVVLSKHYDVIRQSYVQLQEVLDTKRLPIESYSKQLSLAIFSVAVI